uniref:V-type ATP synthase subunit D n=1 Tax=candidate division WOR-3 bacterium TaxID=2052148 RepID=A0A7V4E572_UNCW3
MPLISASPTRMELLRLKRRIAIARKGHKLLKDKQDELVRILFELLEGLKELRKRVEDELSESVKRFVLARAFMEPEEVEELFLVPSVSSGVEIGEKKIMTVVVPTFRAHIEGSFLSYGFAGTSPELDVSLESLMKTYKDLIELAEKEKNLELLAIEVEKTRRRVNALEYILIPELESTIKFISMKLSEMERSDITRLMKIKDIVRAH